MLLFVYGTLLRGEENHAMLAVARFVRAARTVPAFELCDLGDYPALIAGGSQAIEGELYDVDEATLRVLDDFEEHPHVYRRAVIELDGYEQAEAYLLPRERAEGRARIVAGRWSHAPT